MQRNGWGKTRLATKKLGDCPQVFSSPSFFAPYGTARGLPIDLYTEDDFAKSAGVARVMVEG
jgi:hypothetical protein